MSGDNGCVAVAEKENVAPANNGRVRTSNNSRVSMGPTHQKKSCNSGFTISPENYSTTGTLGRTLIESSMEESITTNTTATTTDKAAATSSDDFSPNDTDKEASPTSPMSPSTSREPLAPTSKKSKKSFTLIFNRRSLAFGIGIQQRKDLSSVSEDTPIDGGDERHSKTIFPVMDSRSDGEAGDTKTKNRTSRRSSRGSRGEYDQGVVAVTRSPSSESEENSGADESIVEEERSLEYKAKDLHETIITIIDNENKKGNDRGPTGALSGANTNEALQRLLEEQVVREQRLATLEAENLKLSMTVSNIMAEDAPQATPKIVKKNLFSWASMNLSKPGKSSRTSPATPSKSPKLTVTAVTDGDQESRASIIRQPSPASASSSNNIQKLKQDLEDALQISQKLLDEKKRTAKFLKERFISLQKTKSGEDSSGSSLSPISNCDLNEGPFLPDPSMIFKSLSHVTPINLLKTMPLEDFLDPNRTSSDLAPTPKSENTWRTKFRKIWTGTKNDVEQWEKWIKNWGTFQNTKRVRNMLWGAEGVPNEIRGELWLVCLEPRLYREITTVLYGMLTERMTAVRAKRDDEVNLNAEESSLLESLKQLELDLDRTLPRLMCGEKRVFGCAGPKGVELGKILEMFSAFRPDIGYCQGMSFLAAMVALHIENEVDQFRAFMHVVNLPFFYAAYTFDMTVLRGYFAIYDVVFEEFLPGLRSHFVQLEVDCSIFLTEWWFTCFVRSLPLRIACRFWDGLMIHGESMLFWASIALVHYYEPELMKCETFDEVLMLLTTKPGDIDSDRFWELWAQQNWPKQIRINPIM